MGLFNSKQQEYSLGKEIGRGAFGVVNELLLDNKPTGLCAKRIKINTKVQLEAIQKEIALLGAVSHPNIVAIHSVEPLPKNHEIAIVMELCGEGSLDDLLKKSGPMSEFFVWTILISLAGALVHLNGLQIVHRDIKPENILITGDNQFKLADFGLAKVVPSLTDTWAGTPLYMAPEVLKEESYGKEVDVWSLGCCLYKMMTGQPPFEAKSIPALLPTIQKGPKPLPEEYSASLRDLVMQMLSVDPKSRPSVAHLLNQAYKQRDKNLAEEYNSTLGQVNQLRNDEAAFSRLVQQKQQEFAAKRAQLFKKLQRLEFKKSLAEKTSKK